jgi:hypothetical protein
VQAVKSNMYDDDPILSSCGIEIEKQLTRVDARVLSAPAVSLFCLLKFSFSMTLSYISHIF